MNDAPGTKQQIVERIKSSTNILVTVSTDPSVDELSAALGLALMLNTMGKHATAVMSGSIPPAITFLEPEKTFENTVDSLRDFIIALDKEKADHLRYKVDGDVVKIFITPYRTTITQDDLDFSQGDYNVELVLALGVKSKENLDTALTAHGRILHDATVATLSCGDQASDLGSIDWFESGASSLSEMLVSLSEALKGDKPLLDEQTSTALLTGIVAATDRFSNNKTSSKVMTMAAQLMAAGANQQLIAAKLEEAHEIGPDKLEAEPATTEGNSDGTTDLAEGESQKLSKADDKKKSADGTLAISHEKQGSVDEVAAQTAAEQQADAATSAEDELADKLGAVAPVAPSSDKLADELAAASESLQGLDNLSSSAVLPDVNSPEPALGGTLNATTEQAARDKALAEQDMRNHTILSHDNGDYVGDNAPMFGAPFNATAQGSSEPAAIDVFGAGRPTMNLDKEDKTPETPVVPADSAPAAAPEPSISTLPPLPPAPEPVAESDFIAAPIPAPNGPTLAEIDEQNRVTQHEDAQAAVAAAFDTAPFDPSNHPEVSVGAQPLGGSLHDASPLSSTVPPLALEPSISTLPPLPDFSTLPPPPASPAAAPSPLQGSLPPEQLGQIFGTPPPAPAPDPSAPKDPNQFSIPGQ